MRERTEASVDFSNKIGIAIEGASKRIPLSADFVLRVGGEIFKVIDKYEHEPIDSVLALNYNLQANKICGLLRIWEKEPEGESKQNHERMLNLAIRQMFGFVDDYRNNRPVKLITEYGNGSEPEPNFSTSPDAEKIIAYLQDKIERSSNIDARDYWKKMLEVNRVYIKDCYQQSDSQKCLEELWQEIQRLNFHY